MSDTTNRPPVVATLRAQVAVVDAEYDGWLCCSECIERGRNAPPACQVFDPAPIKQCGGCGGSGLVPDPEVQP